MDCRLINQDTIKQVADLWDCCFEKKTASSSNGIFRNMF